MTATKNHSQCAGRNPKWRRSAPPTSSLKFTDDSTLISRAAAARCGKRNVPRFNDKKNTATVIRNYLNKTKMQLANDDRYYTNIINSRIFCIARIKRCSQSPGLHGRTFHFAPIRMRNPWSHGMQNHNAASGVPIPRSLCAKNPWAFTPLSGAWRPMDFYRTFTLLAVFRTWSILVTIMVSSVEKLDFILQSTLDYSVSASNKTS